MNENGHRTETSSKLLITPASSPDKQNIPSPNTCDVMPPNTKDNITIKQQQNSSHVRVNTLQCNGFTDPIVVTSSVSATGLTENQPALQSTNDSILYQIIAKDVQHPRNSKMVEKNIDSRSTVVKKAPYGAVQITYKNMINTVPVKTPIPILPKPSPNHHQQQQKQQQNYQLRQQQQNHHQQQQQQQQQLQQQQSKQHNLIEKNCLSCSSSLDMMYAQKGEANRTLCQYSTNLSICLPKPPIVPPASTSIIQNSNSSTYTTNIFSNSRPSSMNTNFSLPSSTSECNGTSNNDIKANSNPFTNLDIDLSCLNTDVFDVTNDFFMSDQQTSDLMNSDDSTLLLSTSVAQTSFAEYVNSTISETFSSTANQSPFMSEVSNLQQGLMVNASNDYLQSPSCNDIVESHTPVGVNIVDSLTPVSVNMVDSITPAGANMVSSLTPASVNMIDSATSAGVNMVNSLSPSDVNLVDSFTPADVNMVDSITPAKSCCEDISNPELVHITDVSPESSTCSGGSKIILIGTWNAKDARYQCQFGVYVVQAQLIQSGVLRCYSPIHKPGTVKLSVLRNGIVISKETDFTFTSDSNEKKNIHKEWLAITDKSLIRLLAERVSYISEMIGEVDNIMTSNELLNAGEEKIEDVLLESCKKLMNLPVDFDFDYNIENTMTVLHLASALGYLKLIQLLMNWVEANPNKIIMAEANPRCRDQFSLLPIMWSSAKGYFNTTCVLHQWAEDTLELKDQCGCNVLNLATECDHGSLVEYLTRLLKKSTVLLNR